MRPTYISAVTNQNLIEDSLRRALYTMLNAIDMSIPSLGHEWDTSNFLKGIAQSVSDAMYAEGEKIMKSKAKDFKPEKTRITKDVIEEMWLAGSRVFGDEIAKGFLQDDASNHFQKDNNRIPGLEEIVREGGIISHADGFRNSDDPEEEDLKRHHNELREKLIENLENADYRDEFLRIARNNFFTYLQEKYEIFNDGNSEVKFH